MFVYIAENRLGQSEPTEIIEPFIEKNPFDVSSAPRELKVTGVTRSSCQLQWLPPSIMMVVHQLKDILLKDKQKHIGFMLYQH